MIHKVLAYIVREKFGTWQLLVFEHAQVDAGIQIPKGTLEPNETSAQGAQREVLEETGLDARGQLHYLGNATISEIPEAKLREPEEWNFLVWHADEKIPEVWEHSVRGWGKDEGMLFRFYWLPLVPTPKLAGGQDAGLQRLRTHLEKVQLANRL